MQQFIFSVIIPIYNVEDYIEETIDSIINQTVGFEHIQLILIDDGSTDNSEKICLKYKTLYPNNVIYIKQGNSGVSNARNNGLKLATGKYINFLDSDDKWSKNAFEKGLKQFKRYPDIGAVIYPLTFFEASTKQHPLNFMFKKNGRVNILKDYQYIKLSSCSTIFRADVIKNRTFSDKLKISEDCRLITEIFLEHPNIGVVSDAMYYYRKRITQSSTIQTSTKKKTWYVDTPKHCYQYIVDLSKQKYGRVIEYVQFLLIYDLHWRMDVEIDSCLNTEEREQYLNVMHELLTEIDDRLIIDFPIMKLNQKLYMLAFKHNSTNIFSLIDNNVFVKETCFDASKNFSVMIDNIVIDNDYIDIYGRMTHIPNVLENIYLKTDTERINFDYYDLDRTHANQSCLDNKYQFSITGIHAKVNLATTNSIKIMSEHNKGDFYLTPVFTYSSILNNNFTSIYLRSKNYYLKYIKNNKKLHIYKKNIKNALVLEGKCIFNLIKRRKWKSLIYRMSANTYKLFNHKPIWLLSDRIQVAGDNGEAMFHYLMKRKDVPAKVYFVLSSKSQEYKKLKNKYPNSVVGYNTFKHKMLHLNAKKIISAQADNYVTNLFGNGKDFIGDLYRFQFTFLQHGITKDDLSPWLNVNSNTINVFITASKMEYESFIDTKYRYNFPKRWIRLTGFARYDRLLDKDVKQDKSIVIMPTWRKNLVSILDSKTGKRVYDSQFKETEYFKFYNDLINNEQLLGLLESKGYKLRFIPHINMSQQLKDFKINPLVEIVDSAVDYAKEFKRNSILITDYSSVFFDFAYLRKPIVYTQFDSEKFFEGQAYDKGYFSYENDGFGPVCKTVSETVSEISKIIDNNCQLEEKYLMRVKYFYSFHDQNNCERIYDEIIKYDN